MTVIVTGRNIEAATKSMLKALSQLETPEEKIAALCSRYADLLSEHKQLQNYLKDTTKSQQQVSVNHWKGMNWLGLKRGFTPKDFHLLIFVQKIFCVNRNCKIAGKIRPG